MNIIALDIHSATFTIAIQNHHSKLARVLSRETSEKNPIEDARKTSDKKWLIVEGNHLAQREHTTRPYADKLTVCDPRQNCWIAEDGFTEPFAVGGASFRARRLSRRDKRGVM